MSMEVPLIHGFSLDDLLKIIGNQFLIISRIQIGNEILMRRIQELEEKLGRLESTNTN